MASIYPRPQATEKEKKTVLKKGSWWIKYTVGHEEKRYSLNIKDKKLAELIKKEKEIELSRKIAKLPSTIKTKDFLQEYFKHIKVRKNLDTYKHEESRLSLFVEDCPRKLNEISTGDIHKFLTSIAERKDGGKPRTVNHYLKHIKTFLKYAMECNYVYTDPTKGIKKIKETNDEPRCIENLHQNIHPNKLTQL